MFKHRFIAAYWSNAAFARLSSDLIILAFFLLVNRSQVSDGFDACVVPCGCSKPRLSPFGGLAGRDGEYAAGSPFIPFPVAVNTRLSSSFLFHSMF